jgi:hypothetical protein
MSDRTSAQGPLVSILWGDSGRGSRPGTIFDYSIMIGTLRIRQVRVMRDKECVKRFEINP